MRIAIKMKTFITFFVSTLLVTSGFAQYGQRQYSQTVTISFIDNSDGNNSYQVLIDGTNYSGNSSENESWNRKASNTYSNNKVLNNILPGQHALQVYRSRNNDYRSNSPLYSSTFFLRQGFDATLSVGRRGQVQLTERQNGYFQKGGKDRDVDGNRDRYHGDHKIGEYNESYGRLAMADYQFSQTLQNICNKWFNPLRWPPKKMHLAIRLLIFQPTSYANFCH